jgi:DNA-binding CsgD family transcriptional regulator
MSQPPSELEAAFDTQWRRLARDLPEPEAHYRFFSGRRWEFDRAWVAHKVAVELEGTRRADALVRCHNCNEIVRSRKADGTLGKPLPLPGWHQSYARFTSDKEKYNAAVDKGWLVLRFVHDDVYGNPFEMVDQIRRVIDQRQATAPRLFAVTEREHEVLVLLSAGNQATHIAKRLGISTHTAKRHIENLRGKLQAPNRTLMVARAIAWGVLKLDEIPWADSNMGLDGP